MCKEGWSVGLGQKGEEEWQVEGWGTMRVHGGWGISEIP